LTGESVPVEKGSDAEVFAGTLVVRGAAYVEITRTGAASAMGRIAEMLGQVHPDPTPLERRLEAFGNRIAAWVVALATLLVAGGVWVEGWSSIDDAFVWAVALAVAAIPEGLPAVLSLTLALGVERMSRRQAVVRKLAAVEALGSVTVICTDKTGTLTENRMLVREVDSPDLPRALRAMALANEADPDTGAGDPLETSSAHARGRAWTAEAAARLPAPGTRAFDSAEVHACHRAQGADPESPEAPGAAPRSPLPDYGRRGQAERARRAPHGAYAFALAWRREARGVRVGLVPSGILRAEVAALQAAPGAGQW
jgi:Ca2+-transporting ATPase